LKFLAVICTAFVLTGASTQFDPTNKYVNSPHK
jgi:hypothetical protein